MTRAEPSSADAGTPQAMLVMARAPRPGTVRRGLEPLLGAERCALLEATLLRRAADWATAIAPESVHVAYQPPDAGPELRALLGPDVRLRVQDGTALADAGAWMFAAGDGPVVIVWPELPRWRAAHTAGLLSDLASGCDVVLGPVFEGGFYLVGFARPVPEFFTLSEDAWRSPDAMVTAIAVAHEAGLELGLLRAERGLNRPDDFHAALADPLTDSELKAILRPDPGRSRVPVV